MKTIIAASKNKHKIDEMEKITGDFGFRIVTRHEAGVPDEFEVEEDGKTFEENSFKKADAIMRRTGKMAIADDSGLEVDALDGAPGVFSARFAGEDANDEKNNDLLIEKLEMVPFEKRSARFVSVITIVYPDGSSICARGECPGYILTERHGDGGFGYDPLFRPDGYKETFGQMGQETKNKISHRSRALEKLREILKAEEDASDE